MGTNSVFANIIITFINFAEKVEIKTLEKQDYLLYFGRFSEEKEIGTFIQTVKELPNIQFIFDSVGLLEKVINGWRT